MAKWTDAETAALMYTTTYDEWRSAAGTDRTYNAWEKKRRVMEFALHDDDDLDEDEQALVAQAKASAAEKAKFSKASDAAEAPNLGQKRTYPDIITFEPAFVDLETTNLKANFGRILCASVADMYGNVRTFRIDEEPWRREKRRDDSALAVGLRDYVEQFDFLVTWYGKMFDVPYLNTRLLIANERPMRADVMHLDPIYKAGHGSLALHSRRLDAVAKTFRLPVQKTGLDPDIWNDAADGDKDAMDYVVEHCEADVLVLRYVFHILKPLVKVLHR